MDIITNNKKRKERDESEDSESSIYNNDDDNEFKSKCSFNLTDIEYQRNKTNRNFFCFKIENSIEYIINIFNRLKDNTYIVSLSVYRSVLTIYFLSSENFGMDQLFNKSNNKFIRIEFLLYPTKIGHNNSYILHRIIREDTEDTEDTENSDNNEFIQYCHAKLCNLLYEIFTKNISIFRNQNIRNIFQELIVN